jgi:hypothetical protein
VQAFYSQGFKAQNQEELDGLAAEFKNNIEPCQEHKQIEAGSTICVSEMRYVQCLKAAAYKINQGFKKSQSEENQVQQTRVTIHFDKDACEYFAKRSRTSIYKCTFDCVEATHAYIPQDGSTETIIPSSEENEEEKQMEQEVDDKEADTEENEEEKQMEQEVDDKEADTEENEEEKQMEE